MGNYTANKMFTEFYSTEYADITVLSEKSQEKFLYIPFFNCEKYSETEG